MNGPGDTKTNAAASRQFVERSSEFVGTYRLVLALALPYELQAVSLRVALWKVFYYKP